MDSPYVREINVCVDAIRRAAQISETVIANQDKGVIEKDDLSPVTVADFAIQALLVSMIHAQFPTDGFVGEESSDDLRRDPALLGRVWGLVQNAIEEQQHARFPRSAEQMCDMIDWCGHGEPGGEGRVWVFDPIDGTKTFVRGEMYAINVALLEQGTQVLGVVGCPKLAPDAQGPISNDTTDPTGQGSILFAARGHGTYVQPLSATVASPDGGNREPPPPRRIPLHAEAATTSRDLRSVSCVNLLDSGVDDVHKLVASQLGVAFPGCDLLGWVPRWVSLALGLSNMTVWVYKKRERSGKIWDHAGAMLMFEEVGGKITDIDGKDIQLTVGRKMTANHGFVAAPKHLHHVVLATVQHTLRQQDKAHLLAPGT